MENSSTGAFLAEVPRAAVSKPLGDSAKRIVYTIRLNQDTMDSTKNNPWEEGVSPLKTIRTLLGLTQKEFAARIDSDQNVVSRWERGVYEATFTIAQIKAMDGLLREASLTWQDVPDSLAPYSKSA